MLNQNQTRQINSVFPLHLKTWQWVSVLVLVVMIAGGIFVVLNRGVQISPRGVIITTEKKGDDLDLAQRVLIEYFSLLNEGKYTENEGKYTEAVKFHGSGYNYMNYALKLDLSNPANYPELLKRGCGFLVCENINIIKKEQVSTNEFVFTVQFVYDNGEIVKSYPYCCGEEPPEGVANVPKTEFEYKVKKVGANFFVTTPLLYIP